MTQKIKTTDVRIGNSIQDDKEDIYIVGLPLLAQIKSDSYTYYGIPLTPEILEKIECDKYNDGYLLPIASKYRMYIRKASNMMGDLYFAFAINMATEIDILYLHQLQNLYFSLTGEELTINL